VQAMELALHAFDLLARDGALLAVQLGDRGTGQASLCAAQDRRHDLQIVHQGGGRGRGGFLLPLRLEEQLGFIQNTFADGRRTLPPSRIQLAGRASIAVILGEDRSHLLASFQADARHRHQKLHGHLRGDLAFAHLLLNAFRQEFHQCQPPRYPTHAAVEPPCQLIQAIAETLL